MIKEILKDYVPKADNDFDKNRNRLLAVQASLELIRARVAGSDRPNLSNQMNNLDKYATLIQDAVDNPDK